MANDEKHESDITDLRAPDTQKIPLMLGKVAHVGPFSMFTLEWVEKEHGSFADFQNKMILNGGKSVNFGLVCELMWHMLLNQEDFKDVAEFKKAMPASVGHIQKITEIAMSVLQDSFPSAKVTDKIEEASEGSGSGNS